MVIFQNICKYLLFLVQIFNQITIKIFKSICINITKNDEKMYYNMNGYLSNVDNFCNLCSICLSAQHCTLYNINASVDMQDEHKYNLQPSALRKTTPSKKIQILRLIKF